MTAIDPADEAPQAKRKRYRRPQADEVEPTTPIWCPGCEEVRVAADFGAERRRFSGLKTRCRGCEAAARQTPEGREKTRRYNEKRYANPEYRATVLAAARERRRIKGKEDLRKSRARLQAIVDEWKAEGCVDCGYADVRAIDPDHRDGEIKSGHVSRMVQMCASEQRIRAELGKCVPRCVRCHRRVTQGQRPNRHRSAPRVPPSWQRILDTQDRNDSIKLARGCTDCGWSGWARGLDWDHVRGRKVTTIANMIGLGDTWSAIQSEMAKCEVVCANCHRIRTIERNALRASRSLDPTAQRDVSSDNDRGEPA